MISCTKCGTEVQEGAHACPSCGGQLKTAATPGTANLEVTANPITPVLSGVGPETGDERIRVHSPGTSSDSRLHADGSLELSAEGAEGVGRKGEKRVARTLRHRLREDGVTVSFDYESARDDRGEDAIMRLDGDALTLQITVPPAEVFWREASKGSAREQIEHAARWLGSAVVRKAEQIVEPAQRAKTVLAIDAQHVGVLATLPVIEAYLDEFGDPASELGFSSVWVVGPTTSYCLRIGQGIP